MASSMVLAKKRLGFAKNKLIPDIDENQQFLLWAVDELKTLCQNFILDGHFCLLNASGKVQRIPYAICIATYHGPKDFYNYFSGGTNGLEFFLILIIKRHFANSPSSQTQKKTQPDAPKRMPGCLCVVVCRID